MCDCDCKPNRSETMGELAKALSAAQGQMEGAKKDSENPFFKSSYADLASVWDACREPLTKNGLAIVQTTQPTLGESKGVIVETILMHVSGEWISGTLFMPCVKIDPQSYGSALTYARRYALQSMVGVAPIDDDAESAMPRNPVPKTQQQPPQWQPAKYSPGAGSTQEKPITDQQRKMLWAKMGENELSKDESKSFYDSIAPKTTKDASLFIDDFDVLIAKWRMEQPEPGSSG